MSKININKDLILSIADQDHKKYLSKVNGLVNSVMAASIDKLSEKVSYINLKNAILQPCNELLNNSFVDNSSFVYLLGVNNAQLEMNSAKKINLLKNFWVRLKNAWKNRSIYKRKRRLRKKRKKKKNQVDEIEKIDFDPKKYNIFDLAKDLQSAIAQYLTETSIIELNGTKLRILGKDDFGASTSIEIFLVFYNNGIYKYYFTNKRKILEIDLNSRLNILRDKINQVGKNFNKILKIFNALYFNVNNHMPNQIFMESLLCSCPNNLFEGENIYKVYLKILNYLRSMDITKVKSINNNDKTISNDILCGNNSIINFNKVLKLEF